MLRKNLALRTLVSLLEKRKTWLTKCDHAAWTFPVSRIPWKENDPESSRNFFVSCLTGSLFPNWSFRNEVLWKPQ